MNISIICVPYSNDVARWGSANGPKAILEAGVIAALEAQGHTVEEPTWIELSRGERTRDIVRNLGTIASRTSQAVSGAMARGNHVIVLEGDCTHAPGAAGGVARHAGGAGVVWFDAHGDMNTMASSLTGLWGGMPYAVILGWDLDDWREAAGLERPVPAEAAALVGASDLDEAEEESLRTNPIARLDAIEMKTPDAGQRLAALLAERRRNAPSWYLHLDLDVAGPEVAPGGLTPAPYWPPRQHLIDAMSAAARVLPVQVLALAAYNPAGDPERVGAQFAIDMALAAFGAMQEV